MTIAVLSPDLLFSSRILAAADAAGEPTLRLDAPSDLPPPAELRLLLVDWAARRPDWAPSLKSWCAGAPPARVARVVLYGPHTDLAAHAEARAAGLGPMWARSRLLAELPRLVRPPV
ncbi:MAG: hypothetical protein ACRDHD_01545 [Candidatus Limnocylindria bacterium]